ncbi:LppX_LprAFG lipoprotein [Streptomyces sp. NPDC017936]|uniref:LppX_LprAFG lipoprotein n=1 Tax=Streptomyces sp. NPDC017936 TaxID=3365016 RepID=UPI0037885F71
MRRTTYRGGLAPVVAAVLVGAAACTSPGGPRSPDGPREERRASPVSLTALRAAEKATERAASARVRSTAVMGTTLSLTASGALGWGDGLTGTLSITYTGGTTADTMRALGITTMEARYLPDAYYARTGEAFAARTGGRHWVRYAYEDLRSLGAGADFADQMRNITPDRSVRLLLDSDDVRAVGEETVEGRTTTHYSGTVDVADVEDAGLKRQLEQAGVTGETVDVWVDDRDLLVKKVEKGRTTAGGYSQTAFFSDYGVRVTARRPPAEDTADFEDLLRRPTGAP